MSVKSADDFTVIQIQKIIRLMDERGLATAKDLVGVGDDEIQQLERCFQLEFPKAYRQFLRSFGRSAGFLSPWVAIYFDDLKEIKETFALYLAQGLKYRLPSQALLIANFENTFDFLLCQGAHDPAVYRVDFREEAPTAKKFAPSFSAYLESLVVHSDQTSLPQELLEYEEYEVLDDLMNF